MFTITELLDIAIRIEKNGEKTYRTASQKVKNEQVGSLLVWLSEQEANHTVFFSSLKDAASVSSDPIPEENLNEPLIDQLMNGENFSLSEINFLTITQLYELIQIAIEFERDTILFYELLKSFIQDIDAKDKIDTIIQEEQQHIQKLKILLPDDDTKGE